jgi:hypothetical protein
VRHVVPAQHARAAERVQVQARDRERGADAREARNAGQFAALVRAVTLGVDVSQLEEVWVRSRRVEPTAGAVGRDPLGRTRSPGRWRRQG